MEITKQQAMIILMHESMLTVLIGATTKKERDFTSEEEDLFVKLGEFIES